MFSNFQSAYPFRFLGRFKRFDQELLRYSFISSKTGKKYIVEFEIFPNELYGMKFYLDDFKKSKDRYKMLTHLGEPRQVLRTLVAVGADFVQRYPEGSIAFVGENRVGEDKNCTQRYRVYKMLTATMVSGARFEHVILDEQSAYLLINKCVSDIRQYIQNVQKYMVDNYSDFDSE
jgi:hypothetical protein